MRRVIPHRRRSNVPLIVSATAAAVAPLVLMLWLSYARAIDRSEASLRLMVDIGMRRADRIFKQAELTLEKLARDTGGNFTSQTAEYLARVVYNQTYFREAGLIDERGNLVCTSLGAVQPPIPVAPNEKSDPANPRMQIIGVVRTAVAGEDSVIVSLPTHGRGEVNVLIDPSQFIDLFADIDLGPDGSISFNRSDGRVLAARGAALTPGGNDRSLRLERRSEQFSLTVVGRISRLWALRDWTSDLALYGPISALCSLGLLLLTVRLAHRARGLDAELRTAIRNGEFEAHYQPTIETTTRRCVGAEVLIRWNHPDQGYIRPDVFIAVAEASGLIGPMTEALMRSVVADMSELMRKHPDLHLGINLAPDHFASPRILEEFPRIFNASTIPPGQILLEATERSMIDDEEGTPHRIMAGLRALGAGLALDDFGTGYSSLSYLHKFKFDCIKIDASFVKRIGRDTVSSGLINAIIDLGRKLDVKLIAEGVENELQFKFLEKHGVQYVQGWLFAKAMPAKQFRDFLARQNA